MELRILLIRSVEPRKRADSLLRLVANPPYLAD